MTARRSPHGSAKDQTASGKLPLPGARVRPRRERDRSARERARRQGLTAEWLALWHLRLRGWQVLARRWRSPQGEIDLIAKKGGVLAVIEVKSRSDIETALVSLAPRQRQRIVRAAAAFLQRRPEVADLALRFDIFLVAPWKPPRHIAGAWRADDPV